MDNQCLFIGGPLHGTRREVGPGSGCCEYTLAGDLNTYYYFPWNVVSRECGTMSQVYVLDGLTPSSFDLSWDRIVRAPVPPRKLPKFLFIGGPCNGERHHVEPGKDVWEVVLPVPDEAFYEGGAAELIERRTARYHRVKIRASGVRDSQWTVYTYQRRWAEWEILGHLLDTFPEKQ